LSAGALVDGVDDNGETACYAAVACNVDVLALLLAHRKVKDNENRIPLQSSLDFSESDCISAMLINAGASLDDVCLLRRCAGSLRGALRQFKRCSNAVSFGINCVMMHIIHHCIRPRFGVRGHAAANMLINVCGFDLEGHNLYGLTCTLKAAASNGHEALRCFINAGADINCVGNNGQTPLHVVSD
jgi:hypothetical protein